MNFEELKDKQFPISIKNLTIGKETLIDVEADLELLNEEGIGSYSEFEIMDLVVKHKNAVAQIRTVHQTNNKLKDLLNNRMNSECIE